MKTVFYCISFYLFYMFQNDILNRYIFVLIITNCKFQKKITFTKFLFDYNYEN